jgi:hypothetical protein
MLIHQRDGLWFTPRVLLHKFFSLEGLRTVYDVVRFHADAGEQFIDFVDDLRFIPGILVGQRSRMFCLVSRKDALKIRGKLVRKVLRP